MVDSINVAGWMGGRRGFGGGGIGREEGRRRMEVNKVLASLENLVMDLASPPLTSELVHWIPREYNKAADWLATLALDTRGDRWLLQGSWRLWARRPLVLMSDAGLRWVDGRMHVGMGWVLVDRDSGGTVAAAARFLAFGGEEAEGDVNAWELRALAGGLSGLAAVRAGEERHLRIDVGLPLTVSEVHSLSCMVSAAAA